MVFLVWKILQSLPLQMLIPISTAAAASVVAILAYVIPDVAGP